MSARGAENREDSGGITGDGCALEICMHSARVVDGRGIPDLPRARSHTRYHGALCDDEFLLARDGGLWTLAGAAIVAA